MSDAEKEKEEVEKTEAPPGTVGEEEPAVEGERHSPRKLPAFPTQI